MLAFPTQTRGQPGGLSGHANVRLRRLQIAGYIASTSKGLFKVVGNAIEVAPYGIATPKTRPAPDWPRPSRPRSRR